MKVDNGYTVLSVADKPLKDFDFQWLIPKIERTKPHIIEMSESQNKKLHPAGYREIRGIPVRIVKSSFFGLDV